jgi:O-antigen/teichoic acid export membrane protein
MRARVGRANGPKPTARETAAAAPGILGAGLALAAGQWLLLGPLALARIAAPDVEMAGYFTLAWNATVTLSMMLGAGLAAALPVLGRSRARADGKDALYIDACLRGAVLVAAAAAIGAGALGESAIRLAAGPGYGPAGTAFAAALPVSGAILAGQAIDQVLFLRGRVRLMLALNLGGAAAVTAAFVAVIGRFGAVGSALAPMAVLWGLALIKAWTAAGRSAANPLLRSGTAGAAGIGAFVLLEWAGPWLSLAGGLATLSAAALATGAIAREDFLRVSARSAAGD